MDALLLARLQFALTIGFHFLFPPISIGLAWLLVIMEGLGWRKKDEVYVRMSKFFGKLLALTFAVGVATGIVMEFQFGLIGRHIPNLSVIFSAPRLLLKGSLHFFSNQDFLDSTFSDATKFQKVFTGFPFSW